MPCLAINAAASVSRSPTAAARSKLLASCRDGATEAIMIAHGFSIRDVGRACPLEMLVELVRAALATASAERVVAGGKSIEVTRVRITERRGGGGFSVPGDEKQEGPPRRRVSTRRHHAPRLLLPR